ncbi:hypothetical protein KY284_028758 [Solanum tuberosum]|nr:hypothetical protein KY284_028758 [Solanum tuberosum]
MKVFTWSPPPLLQVRKGLFNLFVLGDSSVNCGDNTFLYPILRGISSSSYLWNAVDLRLIPDLLAKLFFSL